MLGGAQLLQSCLTLCDPMDCKPASLLCPRNSPSKNTGMGCRFYSRGSSQPRVCNCVSYISYVSCIGRQVLYPWRHRGRLRDAVNVLNTAPLRGKGAGDEGSTEGGGVTSCLAWSVAPTPPSRRELPCSTRSKHFSSAQRRVRALPDPCPSCLLSHPVLPIFPRPATL